MSAESIVASLLGHATITALVGARRALGQLPTNTTMPALVYNVIDCAPEPKIAYQLGGNRARARVQINPLAGTIAEVKAIGAAVQGVMDFLHAQTVATKTVVSCRRDLIGRMDKDDEAGIWTQPTDYILLFVE